jgi:uncharacterized membrane protein
LIFGPTISSRAKGFVDLALVSLLSQVIYSLVNGARIKYVLDKVDNQQTSAGKAFGTAFKRYFKLLVANIIVTIVTDIGFLFIILPGIYLYCRLYLTDYYIIDKNMGPLEAMKTSFNRTANKEWHKPSQLLVFYVLRVLLCITIIGIPFAIYQLIMFGSAGAMTYRFMDNVDNGHAAAVPVPVNATAPVSPPVVQPPTPTPPPVPPVSTPPTDPNQTPPTVA